MSLKKIQHKTYKQKQRTEKTTMAQLHRNYKQLKKYKNILNQLLHLFVS